MGNHAQASLTPAQAASIWSTVKAEAETLGAEIVSPAVNYCGGDCNEEVRRGAFYAHVPWHSFWLTNEER